MPLCAAALKGTGLIGAEEVEPCTGIDGRRALGTMNGGGREREKRDITDVMAPVQMKAI